MKKSSLLMLGGVTVFAVAFAFVETSIVVYLRALYYPDGFEFPLRLMNIEHLGVELGREAATIIMLAAVGYVAGTRGWQRFAYFLVGFGVWDIFYYVWLKVLLDWPATLFDWDVLFLIPLPWIGPVVAPVLISLLMIFCGVVIIQRDDSAKRFQPGVVSWLLSVAATGIILYSFTFDIAATLRGAMPQPYMYEFLVAGLLLYITAFYFACTARVKSAMNGHG